MLELAVAVRYASSRLGLEVNRLRRSYERTRDPALLELLRAVLHVQTVLEILAVRLETLASIGIVVSEDLSLLRDVLAAVRSKYAGLQPMLESVLFELENATAALAADTSLDVGAPQTPVVSEGRGVEEVLEEARAIAESRLRELLGAG